jgi:flagellar basal body-associated protein FliL
MVTYRILVTIVLVLVLVLVAGTAYVFISRAFNPRDGETAAREEAPGEENIFSGLGTMRISTRGENPETVIITIAFPYDSGDIPFSEELVSRIPDFKAAIAEYIGALSAEELHGKEQPEINGALLSKFNALLRLGQLKELFFIDFMWL